MKRTSRFFSRLLTAVLSGTIVTSSIPSHAVFVPSSEKEETIPEPEIISVIEGETSEYGLTPIAYVDKYGNETEMNLIPDKEQKAAKLPSQFDLRDYGYITPVKNQADTGTCWAHASLAASESNMIMKGLADNTIDLSEAHLTWFTQGAASMDINDPLYGDGESLGNTDLINGAYDRGGNCWRARATLGRWSGIQLEENVAPVAERPAVDEKLRYTSYGYLVNSDDLDKNDRESIKQHLMNTGALSCSYYTDDQKHISGKYYPYESYYNSGIDTTNHAVTIVGWDDNYSKDNFKIDVPPDDGAWIIKNSWGESNHIDGYFYLSYYDSSLSYITSFEIADQSTYNNIYQYDGSTPDSYPYYSTNTFTAANIFTAASSETISAAAFYTYEASVPYIISIYADVEDGKPTSGTLLTTQNGTMPYKGYHVVDLNQTVAVSRGTKFSVVVTLDKVGTGMAIQKCSNLSNCSYFTSGTPRSFSKWTDTISKYSSTACIKALTRSDILINSSNFPDSEFRNFVSEFDLDSDGALSYSEISQVSEMNLSGLGISDFTGIEFFTELAKLNCSYNPIINLDTSHNSILNDFICIGCSIDVGNIMCSGFTVNGLDMSKVSNVKGMTAEDSMFIPGEGIMSYTYYCGRNYTAEILLNAGDMTHAYGSWSNNGDSHIKTCCYCGDITSGEHSFSNWSGSLKEHSHICLICGGLQSEEHAFGGWTIDGDLHTHLCEICGVSESAAHSFSKFEAFDSEEHTGICESCGYAEQLSHEFGDFRVFDENSHVEICEYCGYSESYEHNFSGWIAEDEDSHIRICSDCGYTETVSHGFGEWTFSDENLHSRICGDCGQIVEAEHNFSEILSSDEENHSMICKDCGYAVDLMHDFSGWTASDEQQHYRICSDCGLVNSAAHNFGKWTAAENGSHSRECTDCGYIDSSPHNFGEWIVTEDDGHSRECTDCGCIDSSLHSFGETTFIDGDDHSNTCEVCGCTEISPHSFGKITYTDSETHSQTCEECGYVHIFDHNFSEWELSDENNHSKICSECNRIITMPHSFCECVSSDEKEHSNSCEICRYTVVSPHSFTDWKDNGSAAQIRICTDCGYSETKEIDYVSGDINGDGTIDSFDLVLARQKLRKDFLSSVELASADINHDGKFDKNDIILLQDFILGKIKML